jgi:heptosyltransferase-2
MAVAAGCRVLACFGPTVKEFGFMPDPAYGRARILESDLPCRPCTLHGGERCPLGHHACLQGILPEEAFLAAQELIARP